MRSIGVGGKMKKYIFIILIILMYVAPISALANVTYPQEYYQISEELFKVPQNNKFVIYEGAFGVNSTFWNGVQYLQMEKQNILLEKQNELQAELINAQWVETCCAPKSVYAGYMNLSAWKSECANAGYPVG